MHFTKTLMILAITVASTSSAQVVMAQGGSCSLRGGGCFQPDPYQLSSPYIAIPRVDHYITEKITLPHIDKFGGCGHIDILSSTLEQLCNELCLDLHFNYSHNPGFRQTYKEAYHVLEVARFIRAAHHVRDLTAMQSQLNGLDAMFHHVKDEVSHYHRIHRRQIGTLGILNKLNLIEDTLHHLMEDVGVNLTPANPLAINPVNPAIIPGDVLTAKVPPPPVGNVQPAIVFGGFQHTEELVNTLEEMFADLCIDMHSNYGHNPDFAATYAEAYKLYEIAKFIHAAEHINDKLAITGKLEGMDELFHHVKNDVQLWSRRFCGHRESISIQQKIELIEVKLHMLMDDVGLVRGPNPLQGTQPPVNPLDNNPGSNLGINPLDNPNQVVPPTVNNLNTGTFPSENLPTNPLIN